MSYYCAFLSQRRIIPTESRTWCSFVSLLQRDYLDLNVIMLVNVVVLQDIQTLHVFRRGYDGSTEM